MDARSVFKQWQRDWDHICEDEWFDSGALSPRVNAVLCLLSIFMGVFGIVFSALI